MTVHSLPVQEGKKPRTGRAKRSVGASRTVPRQISFDGSDPTKWSFPTIPFGGDMDQRKDPPFEEVRGSIQQGLDTLKENPSRYQGMLYSETDDLNETQTYKLVLREGVPVKPKESSWRKSHVWVEAKYQARDAHPSPESNTDDTAQLPFRGKVGKPVYPGRGDGYADVPTVKVVGNIDPTDIAQGPDLGDCWLLSAISALSEYEGMIQKLFRKTKGIELMPGEKPSKCTVSLWDLESGTEVDVVIDESLCTDPDTGCLVGCMPSVEGDLWAPYIEKAMAKHAGGWANIVGGRVIEGFMALTGCKSVYHIQDYGEGGFECLGFLNSNAGEWVKLTNNFNHGSKQINLWPMDWPNVGGGGLKNKKLTRSELFARMVAWEQSNFVMCCGTKDGSDSNNTDGIVDGHAYTILDVRGNVGKDGFNMVKIRNPWGHGEFRSGKWDDDGQGWNDYPDVKEALKPLQAKDGIFWLEEEEFFDYFPQIFLCACDMNWAVDRECEGKMYEGRKCCNCPLM
mmetsp:Transcript_61099/g.154255  ORF Transcript_61099/g.154255 Transcript_61099/m.154255 type:complete len:511 (-) Transcript_61099:167-1699(-)